MNNPRYNNLQIHFGTQRGQEPIGLIRKSYAFKPLSLSLRHSEWVQVTEQNSLSAVRAHRHTHTSSGHEGVRVGFQAHKSARPPALGKKETRNKLSSVW